MSSPGTSDACVTRQSTWVQVASASDSRFLLTHKNWTAQVPGSLPPIPLGELNRVSGSRLQPVLAPKYVSIWEAKKWIKQLFLWLSFCLSNKININETKLELKVVLNDFLSYTIDTKFGESINCVKDSYDVYIIYKSPVRRDQGSWSYKVINCLFLSGLSFSVLNMHSLVDGFYLKADVIIVPQTAM